MRGSSGQESRLRTSFDTYTGTINEATKLASELLNDQSEYSAAVSLSPTARTCRPKTVRASTAQNAAASAT